jgi:hypothetical protein
MTSWDLPGRVSGYFPTKKKKLTLRHRPHERESRRRHRTSLFDLLQQGPAIECNPAVDKIDIATKRHRR